MSLIAAQILKHLKIYDLLFERTLREVHSHFAALNVSAESYLLDWFMTLFSRSLPFDAASRLWDCYLIEGEVFLFRAALALLQLNRKVLKQGEFEEVMHTLREIGEHVVVSELFSAIEGLKAPSYIVEFIRQLNSDTSNNTNTLNHDHATASTEHTDSHTASTVRESSAPMAVTHTATSTSLAVSADNAPNNNSELVPPRVVNLLDDFM